MTVTQHPEGSRCNREPYGSCSLPRSSGFVTVVPGNQHQVLRFLWSNCDMFFRLLCLAFYVFVYFSNELKLKGLFS